MNRLSNKKIVINGAASGIGRAAAVLMVAEGAQVLIADLDQGAADGAAAEIGTDDSTGRAVGTAVDVMDEGSMAAMIDRAVAEFGGIDVLCNHDALRHRFARALSGADSTIRTAVRTPRPSTPLTHRDRRPCECLLGRERQRLLFQS